MPILVAQQSRLVEVGVIRIGIKKQGDGKSFPGRLDTFRFTSRLKHLLDMLAAKYGGEVKQFTTFDNKGKVEVRHGEWELISEAKQIRALFSIQNLPSGDRESLEQWFIFREKTKGRTMRKCDGINCTTWQAGKRTTVPCMCAGNRICKLQSRVRVFLPDAPDVGTFSFITHSDVFSGELNGFIHAAESMVRPGCFLVPILMTLTLRTKENDPEQANGTFPVVLISLDPNPEPLAAMVGRVQGQLLGPAPDRLAELPAAIAGQRPQVTLPAPGIEIIQPSISHTSEPPAPSVSEKETMALEFLQSLDEVRIDDFKTWCQSNEMTWFNAALAGKKKGVKDAEELFKYLESLAGGGN